MKLTVGDFEPRRSSRVRKAPELFKIPVDSSSRKSAKRPLESEDTELQPASKKSKVSTFVPTEPSILSTIPDEILVRILSFCDAKSLKHFSATCTNYREFALRTSWETVPVDCIKQNFAMLDKFPELRVAVRHLRIRMTYVKYHKMMRTLAKRLVQRLKKGYFPGLQEFTFEFYPRYAEYFVEIMQALHDYEPRNLRKLTIRTHFGYSRHDDLASSNQLQLKLPTKLRTIVLSCEDEQKLSSSIADAMKYSKDTLENIHYVSNYWDHWQHLSHFQKVTGITPLEHVTKLRIPLRYLDEPIIGILNTRFPNVKHIEVYHRDTHEDGDFVDKKYDRLWRFPNVQTISLYAANRWNNYGKPLETQEAGIERAKRQLDRWMERGMEHFEKVTFLTDRTKHRIAFDLTVVRKNGSKDYDIVVGEQQGRESPPLDWKFLV